MSCPPPTPSSLPGASKKPKRILELVDEFRSLPHFDLILAGDGALRPELLRRTTGEIVTRSGAGFIYPSNAELRAILAKLTNPTLRASLSRRARQTYLNHHSPEHYLTAYLKLISDITARKIPTS